MAKFCRDSVLRGITKTATAMKAGKRIFSTAEPTELETSTSKDSIKGKTDFFRNKGFNFTKCQ